MVEKGLTNAEERVFFYSDSTAPTIPNSVTPDTPLADLNLNWREKDLPERERTKHVHRLHPYLGKFIPQLAEIFLRKYFKPGQIVLDPFAGSGTTLVQANELGINSIGYDISAFNVLLIKAKIAHYVLREAKAEILDILEKVHSETQSHTRQLSLWKLRDNGRNGYGAHSKYLALWFAPQALRELIAYRDLISNYQSQDIMKVILSRSARSSRLTTHFDLDFPKKPQTEPYWCYKHSRTCVPTETAFQFLRRYSLDTIRRLEEFANLRTNAQVSIVHGDSRFEKIPPVDGVLTSPPYVGLIDYHEQHRYAYELLGLIDKSHLEIGAAKRGASRAAKQEYRQSIAEVFRHAAEYMKKDAVAVVVVHDKHSLYPEVAGECGFEVAHVIERHVNRRTGRRAGEFFEQIYIWRRK